MASTEDKKEIPENEENNENPEEQKEEEEEQVDLELQKEMKGIKIVDSDFSNAPKAKKQNKKLKNPEDKKNKKKGQDFLDYANKNNIQINIEYEENKYQLKKKDEQKNGDKNGNKYNNNNKRQYNKGGYNKNYQQKGNRNTGNKFDGVNQRMYPQPHYYQNYFPKLVENKEILEYLEKIFGEKNLNKDTYIRNRLKDGKILVNDIAAYNNIKKNNIDSNKIMEIIKDSQNLEIVNEEDKNYIKIKDFDKLNLLSIEQIISNKNMMRMRNYAPQMAPYPYNGYINMQNNYYFSFPSYVASNEGYIPTPENK
jgi:hypothetical protein